MTFKVVENSDWFISTVVSDDLQFGGALCLSVSVTIHVSCMTVRQITSKNRVTQVLSGVRHNGMDSSVGTFSSNLLTCTKTAPCLVYTYHYLRFFASHQYIRLHRYIFNAKPTVSLLPRQMLQKIAMCKTS